MMQTLQQRTRKYNPDGSKRPGLDQAGDALEQDPGSRRLRSRPR